MMRVLSISSKSIRPMVTRFHAEPPGVEEMKICLNLLGHMTIMATTPLYGQKLLLRNQSTDDLETWYVASGTQVPPGLFN